VVAIAAFLSSDKPHYGRFNFRLYFGQFWRWHGQRAKAHAAPPASLMPQEVAHDPECPRGVHQHLQPHLLEQSEPYPIRRLPRFASCRAIAMIAQRAVVAGVAILALQKPLKDAEGHNT
jgi:hypothetical protein